MRDHKQMNGQYLSDTILFHNLMTTIFILIKLLFHNHHIPPSPIFPQCCIPLCVDGQPGVLMSSCIRGILCVCVSVHQAALADLRIVYSHYLHKLANWENYGTHCGRKPTATKLMLAIHHDIGLSISYKSGARRRSFSSHQNLILNQSCCLVTWQCKGPQFTLALGRLCALCEGVIISIMLCVQ